MTDRVRTAVSAELDRLMSDLARLRGLLADLDRCVHGRHHQDPCNPCPGGRSIGNLARDEVIGHATDRTPITVRLLWEASRAR